MFLAADCLIHMGFPDPAKATGTEEEIMNEFRKVRDDTRQKMVPFLREELMAGTRRKVSVNCS